MCRSFFEGVGIYRHLLRPAPQGVDCPVHEECLDAFFLRQVLVNLVVAPAVYAHNPSRLFVDHIPASHRNAHRLRRRGLHAQFPETDVPCDTPPQTTLAYNEQMHQEHAGCRQFPTLCLPYFTPHTALLLERLPNRSRQSSPPVLPNSRVHAMHTSIATLR